MNNACHKNIWCANAMVGAGMISGACDNHYHKENFKHDAAHMYTSQNPVTEGFDCDGKPFRPDSCGGLNEAHCEDTVTTNTGAPAPYLNCQLHKHKCNRTVNGTGNYCPSSCKAIYDLYQPYDGRVSVQYLGDAVKYDATKGGNTMCANISDIFEASGYEWGKDDNPEVIKSLQDCSLYYQRLDPKDSKISVCLDNSNSTGCAAGTSVKFETPKGELDCSSPSPS